MRNLFTEPTEAERYDSYRPVYHHLPAAHLLEFYGRRIPKTLDVACGTGHSTRALAAISEAITACDASEEMLSQARRKLPGEFILAKAEQLPFAEAQFDYVNISMAFQWLDQPKFLSEAKRVLEPGGCLGIDNYGFTGRAREREDFLEAYKSFDQLNMKTPPRNKNYPDASDLENTGLRLVKSFDYDHPVPMNKNQFINYLQTRSNFLELPEAMRASTQQLMADYYEPYFSGSTLNLHFRGALRLYQCHEANARRS